LTNTNYGGATYISSNKKILYYTLPGGLIFQAVGDGYGIIGPVLNLNDFFQFWPKCKIASSENGNILYLAGGGYGRNCYMSVNDYNNWKAINLEAGVYGGVACSSDGSIAYIAGGNGRIYQSTDTGATWNSILKEQSWWDVCCSSDVKKVFISGNSIKYSFDSGKSWKEIEKKQIWRQSIGKPIASIFCSKDGTNVYFAENQGGIYYLD